MSQATPFVKWPGGKTQLLPELLKRVPKKFNRYFEPFLGGGAFFFALQAKGEADVHCSPLVATLSDANAALINVYECVQKRTSLVCNLLHEHAATYNRAKRAGTVYYYDQRALLFTGEMSKLNPIQAARFIFLNKTCFNGIYRVNRNGEFNVPWGDRAHYTVDVDNLKACASALHGITIAHADFEHVCFDANKGDFVYFDPPYAPVSETADFTAFTKESFDSRAQLRLRDAAMRLKARGVHVMISNSDVPLIRKLYGIKSPMGGRYFTIEKVKARRSINSNGKKRGHVGELIIT